MSDDIKLEEVNPEASPAEKLSDESKAPDEWQSLDGKSQDRFKTIIQQKNEAMSKAKELEEKLASLQTPQQVPMPPTGQKRTPTPEELAAVSVLKKDFNFVTADDVNKYIKQLEEKVQAKEDRNILDNQHSKLETRFSKGTYPTYDREEVESHMRTKGIYDPETAYNDLYRDEIIKIEAKKLAKGSEPESIKTRSRISSGEPWTPQALQQRLQKPDGSDFYRKNQQKIDKLYQQWRQEGVAS